MEIQNTRPAWLESHDEFEGVGAHEFNPRYDAVDGEDSSSEIQADEHLLPAYFAALASLPSTGPIFNGADISHHQYDAGPVNLYTTRAIHGGDWFACKATQSISYLDPTLKLSRPVARNANFRNIGLYHWLSSTTNVAQQAAWYLSVVGQLANNEFAMLDAEEAGITAPNCDAWCKYVENGVTWNGKRYSGTGKPVVVYTGAYVTGGTIFQSSTLRHSNFGDRPFIIAAYTTLKKMKALPGVASYPPHAWQYSSSGPVAGITGRCDMNMIFDWAAMDHACAGTVVVPEPQPDPDPDPQPDPDPTPPPASTIILEDDPMQYIADIPDRGMSVLITAVVRDGNVGSYRISGIPDQDTRAVLGEMGLKAVEWPGAVLDARVGSGH